MDGGVSELVGHVNFEDRLRRIGLLRVPQADADAHDLGMAERVVERLGVGGLPPDDAELRHQLIAGLDELLVTYAPCSGLSRGGRPGCRRFGREIQLLDARICLLGGSRTGRARWRPGIAARGWALVGRTLLGHFAPPDRSWMIDVSLHCGCAHLWQNSSRRHRLREGPTRGNRKNGRILLSAKSRVIVRASDVRHVLPASAPSGSASFGGAENRSPNLSGGSPCGPDRSLRRLWCWECSSSVRPRPPRPATASSATADAAA